jgi:hypothetical protein
MQEFAGEWVFDIVVGGHQRRYIGPDVVGNGWAWGKDCITGRGVWTRFGHNFTSYGVMLSPTRQITGGQFFNVNQLVATIIGVAENTADDRYPSLVLDKAPHEISEVWDGQISVFDSEGATQGEANFARHFEGANWSDTWDDCSEPFIMTFAKAHGRDFVSGTTQGVSQQIGCGRFTTSYQVNENMQFYIAELLDVDNRMLVSIVQGYQENRLSRVEVSKLTFQDTG